MILLSFGRCAFVVNARYIEIAVQSVAGSSCSNDYFGRDCNQPSVVKRLLCYVYTSDNPRGNNLKESERT